MANHPDGIYQYTSVNIPGNVAVTFTPNAANTPVVWLVQSNCVIAGTISLNGQSGVEGGTGGPGGFRGGNTGGGGALSGEGLGPGGGKSSGTNAIGGNASYATLGSTLSDIPSPTQAQPGNLYGSQLILPLIGGSGGGGCNGAKGGGGGGALLIAASDTILLSGSIKANGGPGNLGAFDPEPGSGSGGSVRLVASHLLGSGSIEVIGGTTIVWTGSFHNQIAGDGRIRLDVLDNSYSGGVSGQITRGFQPIIVPVAGQLSQLKVTTIGGVAVAANPSGVLVTPDAIISGQQANPIFVVVHCSDLPLNTPVTVTVKPANGASVSAVGYNTTGTLSSSTATVSLTMPRGGGIIYATAATGN